MTRWLRAYRRAWIGADLLAGLTVWALIIPEAMAYANIAGIPVQYGLYAVPLAVVGYAIFGSSRHLFVGPSSTVAALSAATVGPVALATGTSPIVLTAMLAIIVGVLYLVGGLLRFGFIARFFAKPVLEGFIIGLGIYIAVGQLPKIVGVEKADGNTIREFVAVFQDFGSWHWLTIGVSVGSVAIILLLTRFLPRIPAALVVSVVAIVATKAFGLDDHGVAIVGPVPTGFDFVPWSGVTWDAFVEMLPGALGILIVGFAEGIAIAKSYAEKYGDRIDPNQEMIGYGAASIGAGVLQGYTVTGSLSKSAAADDAGGKSPMALAVVSLMTVLTILLIAGVFEYLPEATLAAIVICAVAGMIDFRSLRRLWKARVVDFWLGVGALAGVVVLGILPGIVVGVVLSLALFIHRLDNPHLARLGRSPDAAEFGDLSEHAEFTELPGVLVLRFDAPLLFANADAFSDLIADAVDGARAAGDPDAVPVRVLVLDLEACFEVDVTGADALLRVEHSLAQDGIELRLARTKAPVRAVLEHLGVIDELGGGRLHPTIAAAVAAPPPPR